MTGIPRTIRFGLVTVLGLWAAETLPVAAQTDTDPSEVPACRTTAGEDGLVFQDLLGMVYAPVEFASARAEEDKLSLAPEIRDGRGVLALGIPGAATRASVEFLAADGTVVHQCEVKVVAFEPETNDLARLQSGDCSIKQVAGLPQLLAGH